MKVYRLTRQKYLEDFSGKGAALCGARWNSKGTEIIYTAESRALAMAEVAVHLSLDNLPEDYFMIEIDIPDKIATAPTILPESLEPNWNWFPHQQSTQLIGDRFVQENAFCVMRVPSACVKGDFNVLINPAHPDFRKIAIKNKDSFPFDKRLIRD